MECYVQRRRAFFADAARSPAANPENASCVARSTCLFRALTGLILGRVQADGTVDATFADPVSPGFFKPAMLPTAQNVNVSGLEVQPDRRLLVSTAYYGDAEKESFFALRATADGRINTGSATGGVFQADVAPDGIYSQTSALTLQPDGVIVLAGRARRSASAPVVDMAALRLLNGNAVSDVIFADGFESSSLP